VAHAEDSNLLTAADMGRPWATLDRKGTIENVAQARRSVTAGPA
jgi:hypothetical protein